MWLFFCTKSEMYDMITSDNIHVEVHGVETISITGYNQVS